MRLVVADLNPGCPPMILHAVREPVRLGEDVFRYGSISEPTLQRALVALAGFRHVFDAHAVSRVKAVGTSALREAANREEVLQRIFKETGIEVAVINGFEEARLSYVAARERIN